MQFYLQAGQETTMQFAVALACNHLAKFCKNSKTAKMYSTGIPYSPKIWRGIKFGGLAVLGETAKLKSAKIYTACMYVW